MSNLCVKRRVSANCCEARRVETLWTLRRHGKSAEELEALADALIRDHGGRAYWEARSRGWEAASQLKVRQWECVARTVLRKTGKRFG